MKDDKPLDNDKTENNNDKYKKIKHLVEVDDDIHAVFIVSSSQLRELYIAKSSPLDKSNIDSIFNEIRQDTEDERWTDRNKTYSTKQSLLGKMKWIVFEYENYRILEIYEQDKIVVVIINSNTQLEHTVDNILGYYYEVDEEEPKSLF